MRPATFEALAACLRNGSGLTLGPDKVYLLESRLGPVLRRHGLRDLDALAERVAMHPQGPPARDVIEAMTTNESFFFRDDKPFAHLRTHALPRLLARRPAGTTIRIWSAAASTGQEAYSIAMVLDACRAQMAGRSFEILGTDIAREPLARARDGLYSQFEIQRGLPMQMLVRHFRKEGSGWRISEAIRAAVEFREWNLLSDLRPLGCFDVVFCRNVLIYFDQPTKAQVLDAIARQMAPDGVLYLGGAETVLGITDRLVASAGERGVYEPATGQGARTVAAALR
jgi:chemotaxis protein methyltransferase CheR